MVVRKITRLGNSSAIPLDATLKQLMDIDNGDNVKITIEGRKLIVEPLTEVEEQERFEELARKTGEKHAELFRRLAK